MKEMESKGVEKEFLAGSNRRKESQSPKKGRHEAYELPRTGHFWLFFQTSRSSYAQSSYKTVHWQALTFHPWLTRTEGFEPPYVGCYDHHLSLHSRSNKSRSQVSYSM